VVANDIRALLLVVLVAALLGMAGANFLGGGGAFVLGWFSVIIGAALAALLTTFLTSTASLYNALLGAGQASMYGLFRRLDRRPAHRRHEAYDHGRGSGLTTMNGQGAHRVGTLALRPDEPDESHLEGATFVPQRSRITSLHAGPPALRTFGVGRCRMGCSGAAWVSRRSRSSSSCSVRAPVRCASRVILAVLTIVLLALSIAMRPSVEMVRVEIEHRVLDEVERVRVKAREDTTTAARNTHKALSDKIHVLSEDDRGNSGPR
jgi:hypothetical protein